MKVKSFYLCENCGFQSSKWLGKCPNCGGWNSFSEEALQSREAKNRLVNEYKPAKPSPLSLGDASISRIRTEILEFDRVLGGGIVAGSLIVLGGEPGIGKSTLTLQICEQLAQRLGKILYISGEESIDQISLRAKRLDISSEVMQFLNEIKLETIIATIDEQKPNLVILDSIQVIRLESLPGSAGSVNQLRQCAEVLMHFAKKNKIPIILIGHVTKDGQLAGPKVLEHLVDTVLYLEGDRYQQFRILRGIKNRFGSTNEVGIFEMSDKGLQEVKNPSAAFLGGKIEHAIGSCTTCVLEGSRPILVEIQTLCNLTPFGYPKRTASGYDVNRLQLLIAVLQKHVGLNLTNQDVYLNVVGGFQVDDPATDLAICASIISSYRNSAFKENVMAIGEVGLLGEVRQVNQISKRIEEGIKLGFVTIFGPKSAHTIHQGSGKYRELKWLKDLLVYFK